MEYEFWMAMTQTDVMMTLIGYASVYLWVAFITIFLLRNKIKRMFSSLLAFLKP